MYSLTDPTHIMVSKESSTVLHKLMPDPHSLLKNSLLLVSPRQAHSYLGCIVIHSAHKTVYTGHD